MKRSLFLVSFVWVLFGFSATSHAVQLPDADPADWVLDYPSDLRITYVEVGNTGMTLANMAAVGYDPNWPGMGPNNYWNNSFTGDPYSRLGVVAGNQLSWYSQTWGGSLFFNNGPISKPVCPVTATRGVEMRCERDTVKFTFSRPVTDPVLHLNNLGANSYAAANSLGGGGEWADQRLWMHGDTILTLDLAASDYTGTPGLTLESRIGNLAVVTDGPAYHLPGGSPLSGAPAITRTSDPSVDTTGRPGGHYVGGSFGAGSVLVQGTWTEIVFKRDLLWSFNTYSPTTTPWRAADGSLGGYDATTQARNECLLNQLPSPTVYRCDLVGGIWTPNNAVDISTAVYDGLQVANPIPEGTSFVITVDEDFGTAPATYDASDGASHVVGDAAIGSTSTSTASERSASNNAAAGIVSPNAGAADSNDEAFSGPPMLPQAGDYTATIPLSGLSSAAKLCGWIDLDSNGTFDQAERICSSVAAGATSASLTWLANDIAGVTSSTWMRLRLSYDTVNVEQPTGRLDSGEVEDWQISPYSAPPVFVVPPAPTTSAPTNGSTPTTESPSSMPPTSAPHISPQLPVTGSDSTLFPIAIAVALAGLAVMVARGRRFENL